MTGPPDPPSARADRADWRFLLAVPPTGDALWVATDDRPVPDSLAAAIGVVRATDGPRSALPDREYDLVAAVGRPPAAWRGAGPGGWDLARLARCVRPGGQLYLHIRRWAAIGRPSRLRRDLRSHGFIPTGTHAAIPGPDDARVLIPLDDPRPAWAYVDDLLWGGSRARRALRIVLRLLARAGRLDVVVRAVGVTAIREAPARTAVITRSGRPGRPGRPDRGLVAAVARVVQPGAAGGTWLLQRPGESASSPLIVRVWPAAATGQDRGEQVLAKIGTTAQARDRLVLEQRALGQLGPYRSDPSVAVPSALGWTTWGADAIALETVVRGRPIPQWLADHDRWAPTPGGPWDAWVTWLAQAQARSARPATEDDLRGLVLDPLGEAASLAGVGADTAVAGRLERLGAEAVRRHERTPLVIVTAHHDLGPSNVLVDDDGQPVGVIDWESSGPGLPATDLLYFVAQLAAVRGGAGSGGSRGPRETDRWIHAYLGALAVDAEWLPTLAVAGWVKHARNEAARGTPGHAPGARPAHDRLRAALTQPGPWSATQPRATTSR